MGKAGIGCLPCIPARRRAGYPLRDNAWIILRLAASIKLEDDLAARGSPALRESAPSSRVREPAREHTHSTDGYLWSSSICFFGFLATFCAADWKSPFCEL